MASAVADRISGFYFDTGIVYRALTLEALRCGVSPDDAERLTELARALPLRVSPPSVSDGRLSDVWLNDEDVTWAIRAPEVDRHVSAVSRHPPVREALIDLQRRIGRSGRVVMAGRDIGTVVMPDADLKIWLDASLDERARRRQRELALRGIERPLEEIRAEMAARDAFDAARATAPMKPSPEAVRVVTDGRAVEDVVREIVDRALAIQRSR